MIPAKNLSITLVGSTHNTKIIDASPDIVYRAFMNPTALERWQAPGDMKGKIHQFDFRVGGGYEMSLFYPPSEENANGKTSAKEDKYNARYLELIPFKKIVQAITFYSNDPSFAGEMIMTTGFTAENKGTKVTIDFRNIPAGIRPEDNEKGTALTLEKLARYVENSTAK